ncbi:HD-GYP domain-containing protein [Fusibacter sp. JL216-2]|uniref:HD-GYP domain-containing protein n=1 Tax=Fusibacter sp. JL216-2 TaxID=3071453 RepID=UPI003D34D2BA
MKYVEIGKVEPGMILAEAIFNEDGTVELLGAGAELSERHIKLLKRLGILAVKISDFEPPYSGTNRTAKPTSASLDADTVERAAKEAGRRYDVEKFKSELEELEEENYAPVVTNVVNANMVINVLTGDGNTPIDVKHEEMIEETKEMFHHLKESNDIDLSSVKENIEEALPDMIRNNDVLMRLNQLKESDDYTFEHSLRVSILASMIGKWLGYSKQQLVELGQAALLFDIGKMKIPDFILNKEKPITDDEFEVIKRHAQFGYSVLMKTQGVTNNIKYSALQHHERLDGSGYPLRLKSGQIHEFAKIIMVCDIFDAMTTDKPYRKKVSPFKAAEYISWQSGTTLDSKVCYVFLSNLAEFFVGKKVRLSTGEEGTVIYVDVNFPTRPVVQVGEKFVDLVKEHSIQVDELIERLDIGQ